MNTIKSDATVVPQKEIDTKRKAEGGEEKNSKRTKRSEVDFLETKKSTSISPAQKAYADKLLKGIAALHDKRGNSISIHPNPPPLTEKMIREAFDIPY